MLCYSYVRAMLHEIHPITRCSILVSQIMLLTEPVVNIINDQYGDLCKYELPPESFCFFTDCSCFVYQLVIFVNMNCPSHFAFSLIVLVLFIKVQVRYGMLKDSYNRNSVQLFRPNVLVLLYRYMRSMFNRVANVMDKS